MSYHNHKAKGTIKKFYLTNPKLSTGHLKNLKLIGFPNYPYLGGSKLWKCPYKPLPYLVVVGDGGHQVKGRMPR